MDANLLKQAKALPLEEQIELVEAIWENIVDQDAVPPPTKAQQQELERRLNRHLANPDDVMTLEEVTAAVSKNLSP